MQRWKVDWVFTLLNFEIRRWVWKHLGRYGGNKKAGSYDILDSRSNIELGPTYDVLKTAPDVSACLQTLIHHHLSSNMGLSSLQHHADRAGHLRFYGRRPLRVKYNRNRVLMSSDCAYNFGKSVKNKYFRLKKASSCHTHTHFHFKNWRHWFEFVEERSRIF